MSQPELKTRLQLVADAVRRIITYTTEITYFGPNSAGNAIAKAIGGATSVSYSLYRGLLRRMLLMPSSGDRTDIVAESYGAEREGPQRASVLAIIRPHTARVLAITSTTDIEVASSSNFAEGDSIRIRNNDGTSTEIRTINSISSGTGPNSGDEIIVDALAGSYTPSTSADDVGILLRHTVPAGTEITSTAGVNFQTVDAVTIGDANPVLDGESTSLALADKVLCECVEAGEIGNIDPDSLTGFAADQPNIRAVFNPERGDGGRETEADYDLKYRASHGPTRGSQETLSWAEQIAREGDNQVLRAITTRPLAVGTMAIKVLGKNGGTLSSVRKAALQEYVGQRVRSHLAVDIDDVTPTAIEVEASITLETNATLRQVYTASADRLAETLDFRRAAFGELVDEAELAAIVRQTTGVATLTTSTFLPAADVLVDDESIPRFTRYVLTDTATGDSIGSDLTTSY